MKMAETLLNNEWNFVHEITLKVHTHDDVDQMRKEFLTLLQTLIRFDYASFYLEEEGKPARPVGVGLSREELEFYIRELEPIDPFRPLWSLLSDPKHSAIRVSDYVLNREIEETEYYQRTWKPKNIQYSLFAGLGYEGRPLGSLSLYRTGQGEEFSDKEILILNLLKSHLNLWLWKQRKPQILNQEFSPSLYALKKAYAVTDRELEVIDLWSKGLTDSEICQEISISKNTLKKHISNIFSKLSINNRVELLKRLKKPQG